MKTARIEEFGANVGEEVLVRGWIHNKRSSGKLQFLIVRDGSGFAQAVVSKKAVPPEAWDALMAGNAWNLPERWQNPPVAFDLGTPMNFVSTSDIIGGNSGSPVINRDKEIVGLAFDGNTESLPGEFIFAPDKGNRTISVHSQGILEALRHVYEAKRVVEEIERSR